MSVSFHDVPDIAPPSPLLDAMPPPTAAASPPCPSPSPSPSPLALPVTLARRRRRAAKEGDAAAAPSAVARRRSKSPGRQGSRKYNRYLNRTFLTDASINPDCPKNAADVKRLNRHEYGTPLTALVSGKDAVRLRAVWEPFRETTEAEQSALLAARRRRRRRSIMLDGEAALGSQGQLVRRALARVERKARVVLHRALSGDEDFLVQVEDALRDVLVDSESTGGFVVVDDGGTGAAPRPPQSPDAGGTDDSFVQDGWSSGASDVSDDWERASATSAAVTEPPMESVRLPIDIADAYHRLMAHACCQFFGFRSRSITDPLSGRRYVHATPPAGAHERDMARRLFLASLESQLKEN